MNRYWTTVSILAIALATPAAAQEAAAAADAPAAPAESTPPELAADAPAEQESAAQEGGLEEIIVVAQRRAEQLQDVPISITAITSETLAAGGVVDTQSLTVMTPGLQLNSVRSAIVPFLRGVGSLSINPGDEGATAIYVDGVLYPIAAANVFSLNNVERVEVLRGPQGTLFGRNAVGGLINIITRKPSEDFGVEGEVGYGNYDTFTGTGYVTGGLASGVAADLAVYYVNQGNGWGYNSFLGVDTNKNEELALRSKVLGEFGATTVTLTGDYTLGYSDIGSSRQVVPGARVTGGGGFAGTIYDNTAETPPYTRKEQYGGSLRIEQELGDFELQSTTAYRHYDVVSNLDSDGTPLRVVSIITRDQSQTFQQEVLLTGSVGTVDLTAGLFYFFSDAGIRPFFTRSVRPPLNHDIYSRMRTNSYAGFAQGTYELTPSTRLTAGLRYTRDEREIEAVQYAAAGNTAPVGTVLITTDTFPEEAKDRSWGKLTWRGVIDQELAQDVMAYASISRGFKSGTFGTASPFSPAVEPETLDAYEVGLKADLFDRSLRVNLAAYHYDYKNIQLTALTPEGAIVLLNAAAADIDGADAEITYVVPIAEGRLQFRANASYVDGIYSSFPRALFFTPLAAGGNAQVLGDATGNRIINTPKFTTSVGVDYAVDIGSAGTLELSATWAHNSGFYWDPENRLREPAYNIVNTQISFAAPDESWRVRLFARNLLDERYYAYVSPSRAGDPGAGAPPLTYGVAVGFKF
jgi:iron complex outermembrane receptor protein